MSNAARKTAPVVTKVSMTTSFVVSTCWMVLNRSSDSLARALLMLKALQSVVLLNCAISNHVKVAMAMAERRKLHQAFLVGKADDFRSAQLGLEHTTGSRVTGRQMVNNR